MNIYIVTTTTGDRWEISEGVYIVSAPSEENVREIVEKHITGSMRYYDQKIESVQKLDIKAEEGFFHFDQRPVVE